MKTKKGTWVQIRAVVLMPDERAPQVPLDTKQTPLTMWVKGHLCHDAKIGEECKITTVTGRIVSGILEEVEPYYTHNFGGYVPELDAIRKQVREF
ncbi:MAG: 2-amino-4-oxopentanoate thiolase subunit OrtA [Firmicutes bacterium]|nr:2-amino-4-oxopentanoate thiolase subunit OrtA [Bacillota bacterium]